jgi:hypothetical protein
LQFHLAQLKAPVTNVCLLGTSAVVFKCLLGTVVFEPFVVLDCLLDTSAGVFKCLLGVELLVVFECLSDTSAVGVGSRDHHCCQSRVALAEHDVASHFICESGRQLNKSLQVAPFTFGHNSNWKFVCRVGSLWFSPPGLHLGYHDETRCCEEWAAHLDCIWGIMTRPDAVRSGLQELVSS